MLSQTTTTTLSWMLTVQYTQFSNQLLHKWGSYNSRNSKFSVYVAYQRLNDALNIWIFKLPHWSLQAKMLVEKLKIDSEKKE